MGLDMYLEKCDRNSLKDILTDNYENLTSYPEDVGYWRKANAIHGWFVDNVQGGKDDCETYEVNLAQLQELLNSCKEVIKASDSNMPNVKVASKLLPTRDGFFFGSTAYDEYYLKDIKTTIDILTKVLQETDFTKEAILYHSSW